MAVPSTAGWRAGQPETSLQEELHLKYAYWGMIMVMMVIAVIMCGCAGGPGTTPLPAGTPAGTTATPNMAKSGSLFDTGRLKWFEYRLTTVDEGGKAAVSDVRLDYATATVNGIVVRDDRITLKLSGPAMVVTMDSYYDMATDRQIGGHMKMVTGDVAVTDQDVAAAGDRYRSSDIAGTFAASDWPLADPGAEAVTVDGRTYACTRYSVGNAGEHGTAWVAPGVPVPVKIESRSAAGESSTWELTGWG